VYPYKTFVLYRAFDEVLHPRGGGGKEGERNHRWGSITQGRVTVWSSRDTDETINCWLGGARKENMGKSREIHFHFYFGHTHHSQFRKWPRHYAARRRPIDVRCLEWYVCMQYIISRVRRYMRLRKNTTLT